MLDAARGIAALSVMLFHVQKYIYPNIIIPSMPSLFHRSFLAVDLFFLMSGLVIARSYETKILNGKLSLFGFCRTRWVRLYPLYFIGTMGGFAYAVVKLSLLMPTSVWIWPNAGALLLNAIFLPNLADRSIEIFPFDPAAWSLALEWLANLLYAIIAVHQSTKRLAVLAVVSFAMLVPCAISNGSLDMGWGASTAVGGALRVCFAFTMGVIIWRFISVDTIKVISIYPFILLSLLTLVILTPFGYVSVYYDLACDLLIFPVFVFVACFSVTPSCLAYIFINLGRISYALYILHNPLMSWFGGFWKLIVHQELSARPLVSGPLLLAFVIGGSALAIRVFDEPIRRVLSKRAKRVLVI